MLKGRKIADLLAFGLCIAGFVGLLIGYIYTQHIANEEHKAFIVEQLQGVEKRIQQLDAGIQFDVRRRRLLLNLRDEIQRINPDIEVVTAYDYAVLVIEACEKYPSVDPRMLVAIGAVESGYKTAAISTADARGLYQLWPATARTLFRALSWEYSTDLLHNPVYNTELAALYLEILHVTHPDNVGSVLAEYNGGPRNAHYFEIGSSMIARETAQYVVKVSNEWEAIKGRVGDQ